MVTITRIMSIIITSNASGVSPFGLCLIAFLAYGYK
jgi:hypothetical protein